jgi:hypothetical protein
VTKGVIPDRNICFSSLIMCLNITGQRESDGDKLNRSSLDIVVSESPGWYHSYSFRNKRCEKKTQFKGGERNHVWICKTRSDVVASNIILIFKNKTTSFVTLKCLNVLQTYNIFLCDGVSSFTCLQLGSEVT